MADIFDKGKRRKIMQAIGPKDTRPEWIVRKCLHAHGFRYRLHVRKMPGRPDIVLRKYGTVVLVHGCFWHGHDPCRVARMPQSNKDFWEKKIAANRARDRRNLFLLQKLGWTVWVIFECELRTATDRAQTLGRLLRFLHGRHQSAYFLAAESLPRYEVVQEELPGYRLPSE